MRKPKYGFDPDSLREVLEDPDMARARVRQLRARVSDTVDPIEELRSRGELVGLLRVLGELDGAVLEARRAISRAESVGSQAQQHLARLRFGHVQQWRGDFEASNATFADLLSAAGRFGPPIEAFTHQHADKNAYDQGLWAMASDHFARALAIREEHELPDADSSRLVLEAVRRRAATT